jgi:hypothetical protein
MENREENSEKIGKIRKKGRVNQLAFLPYFSYLFTIQLTLLPYFPYFTFQLTFLPYFSYLFTIQPTFLPYCKLKCLVIWKIWKKSKLNSEKIRKIW